MEVEAKRRERNADRRKKMIQKKNSETKRKERLSREERKERKVTSKATEERGL